MRKSLGFLIVVLASALGACVPSVYPLYTDKDLQFDPALVGVWSEDSEPAESWTFTKDDATTYKLVLKDKDKSGTFEARLLKLGTYRFLDLAPDGDSLEGAALSDIYKASLIPGHLFAKVTQIEPTLQMAFLDPDWLGKRLEAHPDELAHRGRYSGHGEHDIVLLAPTKDLQKFMLKHADDKGAFGEGSNMKKRK